MKTNDFNLDEMKALWQRQSRALEGRNLVDEASIRRAMESVGTEPSPAEEAPRVWRMPAWARRSAAAVAVVAVAAVAVWQWPAGGAGSATTGSNPVVAEAKPATKAADTEAAAPTREPATLPHRAERPAAVAQSPAANPAAQTPQQQEPAAEAAQDWAEPLATDMPQGAEMALAQVEQPRAMSWPSRQERTDTLVVRTGRLVHFEEAARKSFTETLFESMLASR